MPAQFTFYSDKLSEQVISNVVLGQTTVSVLTANLLDAPAGNEIGQILVEKDNTVDLATGNVWADFYWRFQFNDGSTLPSNMIQASFAFFNQTTSGENPTEIIPAGQTSVTVTGGINQASSTGQFCNQLGYVVKTKDETRYRQYDVYFPEQVVTAKNVFNSLPQQPSVAPLF